MDDGFEGIHNLISSRKNNTITAELDWCLQANMYERTEVILEYVNGYKHKSI